MQTALISFGTLATVIGGLWYLSTLPEYKGKKLHYVVSSAVAGNYQSIFILFILAANIGTAGIAASISDGNVGPLFRFIAHFSMNFLSFVSSIGVGASLMNLWLNIRAGLNLRRILSSFGISIVLLAAAFFIPILNLYVIAAGFKNTTELTLFLYDTLPFLSKYYVEKLVFYQKDLHYSPISEMSYPVVAELCLFMTHVIAETLLALFTWGNANNLNVKGDVDSLRGEGAHSTTPNKEKPVKESSIPPAQQDALKEIAEFMGPPRRVEQNLDALMKLLNGLDPEKDQKRHDTVLDAVTDSAMAVVNFKADLEKGEEDEAKLRKEAEGTIRSKMQGVGFTFRR